MDRQRPLTPLLPLKPWIHVTWGAEVVKKVHPACVSLAPDFFHQISELLPFLPPESMQPLLTSPLDASQWVRAYIDACEQYPYPEMRPVL